MYSTKEEYETDKLKLKLSSKGRVLAENFVIKYSYVPYTKSIVCNRSHAEVTFRVRQYFEKKALPKKI